MSNQNSGTALYRRYRSQKFSEVIGQDHVTKTLANAVKNDRLSHAYLFVGPRGVGKTSVARILAREANNLKASDDNHLDVIEIDAASNRGIDEIRDLREKVHLAPSSARYKVYIIDEVHMLTAPAFSALLKTLEEPPAHVIFIMATTEGHKVPTTIVSRTQRFMFLPLATADVEKHLAEITKLEQINIEPKALHMVAQFGFGSLRDSLSLLDQLSHNAPVKASDVTSLIGLAPEKVVKTLHESIYKADTESISRTIDQSRAEGISPAMTARQLIEEIRKSKNITHSDVGLFNDLLEVATSPEPELKLEAILLSYALSNSDTNVTPAEHAAPDTSSNKSMNEVKPVRPGKQSQSTANHANINKNWQRTLDEIKSEHSSLYAVLRQAQPALNGDELKLEFKFAFHKNRVSEDKNIKIIRRTVENTFGQKLSVSTDVNSELVSSMEKAISNQDVNSVIDLMGGGDVMEYNDGQ